MTSAIDPAAAWLIAFAMIIGMKIVCFILGYLTVRLGYKLLLAGVRGEFKFSAKLAGAQADLASVSPGLLFVFLGVALVAIAISVDKSVTVSGNRPGGGLPALHAVPDSLSLDLGGGDSLGAK